jgi:flagellar biosynthetic protein FliR
MKAFEFQVFANFGTVMQDIFVAGIKIGAPVMVALLLMNVTMGIIGRAVPQINVLITSLPVNILVGFIILIVSTPLFIDSLTGVANKMFENMFAIMKEL